MTDKRDDDRHEFSAGQGVDAEYEFTLDPEEIDADPNTVDPVDSRVLTDIMDKRNVESDAIDVERLIDVGLSYMGINRFEEATETFERAASFADEDSPEAQEAWVNNKGAAHAELERVRSGDRRLRGGAADRRRLRARRDRRDQPRVRALGVGPRRAGARTRRARRRDRSALRGSVVQPRIPAGRARPRRGRRQLLRQRSDSATGARAY